MLKQWCLAKQNAKLSEKTVDLQEKLHEKQHISQQRFDLELKIYISLSEKLNNAIDDCVVLIPMIDEEFQDEKAEMRRRAEVFSNTNNIFVKEMRSYVLFYKKKIREHLNYVSLIMTGQYKYFKCRHFDSNMKSFAKANIDVIYKNNTELSTWQTRIIGLIGKGLDELSV